MALFERLTEDKTMQKLLTKSFRKILHAIGTEEIKKLEDGNSRPRSRSLKVMQNIYHVYGVYLDVVDYKMQVIKIVFKYLIRLEK